MRTVRRALLVRDRRIPLEVALDRTARRRGLLGRDGIDGALLLQPAGSIHTVRMRFAIDAAFCTADLEVLAVQTLPPGRLSRPRRRVRAVLEAEAGSFVGWGIEPGVRLRTGAAPTRGSRAAGSS